MLERLPHRTEAEHWDEVMQVTNNQSDQEMLQVHVSESLNTVQWLAAKGHDWVPAGGFKMPSDNVLHDERRRLRAAAAQFRDAGARGRVVSLRNGGAGARAGPEGAGHRRARVDSGRLCDLQRQGRSCWRAAASNRTRRCARATSGRDGTWCGCAACRSTPATGCAWRCTSAPCRTAAGRTCHASPQDINMPAFKIPVAYSTTGSYARYMYPYSIMVNVHGERFVDEAADLRGRTYATMGRAILTQPGGIAFQILDAKARKLDIYPTNYDKATAREGEHAGEARRGARHQRRELREDGARVQCGDPARVRSIPTATSSTASARRASIRARATTRMSIEEPPFEAFPVRCGMTFTYGGLRIDPKTGQVQHVAGRPIAGTLRRGRDGGRPLGGQLRVRFRHDGGRHVRPHRRHARGAGCAAGA